MSSPPHANVRRDFKPVSPEEVMRRRYLVRRPVRPSTVCTLLKPGEMVHDEFVPPLCFSVVTTKFQCPLPRPGVSGWIRCVQPEGAVYYFHKDKVGPFLTSALR